MGRILMLCAAAFMVLAGAMPSRAADDQSRLVIATGAEPDSIDITAGFFPPINYVILRNIDEALWDYNQDGTIRQTVATWDYSKDKMTLVFHLKHGVKFHSGDEFTAEDVVFGFQRLMAKTRPFARHGKHVKKITAVDKYTVRLDFAEPDVNFFDGTSLFPASKAYYDRVGEKEFATHPNGIGPYAFVGYKPAAYFDLKAFPGYYGKQAHFKNVRFEFVKDAETRVAKLRAGEADMIMDTPFPQVAALAKEGFRIVKLPANPPSALSSICSTPRRRGPTSGCAKRSRTRSTATPSLRVCSTACRSGIRASRRGNSASIRASRTTNTIRCWRKSYWPRRVIPTASSCRSIPPAEISTAFRKPRKR